MHNTAAQLPHNRAPLAALVTANTVSMLGNIFTSLTVPWFVLQTTGSVAKTGVAGAVTALSFAASFFGGTLVDRLGFKRVAVATDLTSGIAVALIPLLYHTVGLAYGQLLALIFLRAFLNTAGSTARSSLLPDLITLAGVSKERANGTNQSLINAAELVGASVVGLLIALIGTSNMLWLDGASFLFSASVVALSVPPLQATMSVKRARGAYFRELAEGWQFLMHDRVLLYLRFIGLTVNFVGAALASVLLPVFARQTYGTAISLGLLFAGLSAGILVSSFLYTVLALHVSRRSVLVVSRVIMGLPIFVLALHPPLVIAVIALFVTGLTVGPIAIVFLTVQQERVPVMLRGRVYGVGQALGNAATPFGALVAGFSVSSLGLNAAFVGLAIFLLLTGAWVVSNRTLRTMDVPPK